MENDMRLKIIQWFLKNVSNNLIIDTKNDSIGMQVSNDILLCEVDGPDFKLIKKFCSDNNLSIIIDKIRITDR